MIYCIDNDLKQYRATVLAYMPDGAADWSDFHVEASRLIENDLSALWYGPEAERRGIDASDNPFDLQSLMCGWTTLSTRTLPIVAGDRVRVAEGHTAGGEVDHIYARIGVDIPAVDLSNIDFSDGTLWDDITADLSDDLKDLAAFKTLFLIYRFLANDTPENGDAFERQRDYFDQQYERELGKVLARGLPYQWDDETETAPAPTRRVRTNVIW